VTASVRILLIEDDRDVSRVLQDELTEAEFSVDCAYDGIAGLELLRNAPPDVVLLDLDLPNLSGRQVLERVRRYSQVPVIIITAFDDTEHKLSLFAAGANDYVTKPFYMRELIARIRVQLRNANMDVIDVGQLHVHVTQRFVTYAHREVHVSPREFDFLARLARQPGRVFSYAELTDTDGHATLDGENLIRVRASNVRRKLEQAGGYAILRNVRGIGYTILGRPPELSAPHVTKGSAGLPSDGAARHSAPQP